MVNNERTSRNVIAIWSQVIISGVSLFFLYRFLYDQLGIGLIGVWSLVTSITSISRIGDLGLPSSVVKHVAQALGRGDSQLAAYVVQTAALTLGIVMAVILAAGYPVFSYLLINFLSANGILTAISVLPFVLVSLWMMVMSNVLSGCLDGCYRMDLRGLLTGLSSAIYLGLAIWLVPILGLKGLAIAQLIQSSAFLVIIWLVLGTQLKELPLFYGTWKLPVLKQLLGYGAKIQITSIMNLLFDPVVKTVMNKFGGVETLGYYQMANTLVIQGRALIVEASRVMVTTIAAVQNEDTGKSTQLFVISYKIIFFISVLFYGTFGICITGISLIWLGNYQGTFILFALLLISGWFINTLIVPAYFANLGSGKLWTNVISDSIMGLGSPIFGFILGMYYGGFGVLIGMIIGLTLGSIYLLVSYIKQVKIPSKNFIFPPGMTRLLFVAVISICVSNYINVQQSSILIVIFVAIFCTIPLLLMGWFTPARLMVVDFIRSKPPRN